MGSSNKYSPEIRARAVRMVLEHQGDHDSQWVSTPTPTQRSEERCSGGRQAGSRPSATGEKDRHVQCNSRAANLRSCCTAIRAAEPASRMCGQTVGDAVKATFANAEMRDNVVDE